MYKRYNPRVSKYSVLLCLCECSLVLEQDCSAGDPATEQPGHEYPAYDGQRNYQEVRLGRRAGYLGVQLLQVFRLHLDTVKVHQ